MATPAHASAATASADDDDDDDDNHDDATAAAAASLASPEVSLAGAPAARQPQRGAWRRRFYRAPIRVAVTLDNDPLSRYRAGIERMLRRGGSNDELAGDFEFIPPPNESERANLLRELSRERIEASNHVNLSLFAYLVTRESQALIEACRLRPPDDDDEGNAALERTRALVPDLERILRNVCDALLLQRHDASLMDEEMHNGGDAGLHNNNGGGLGRPRDADGRDPGVLSDAHRLVLWVARCKLVELLRNVLAVPEPLKAVNDHMRVRAAAIDELQLARWMLAARVCDVSMIRFDENGAPCGHALGSCNLMSLWLTLRMLLARWPHLPYDPFVVRVVDELRNRVAFFHSYRERVDPLTASGRALLAITNKSRRKVLGLSLDMWRVRDLLSRGGGGGNGGPAPRIESPTLLNNASFVEHSDGYAHINSLFMTETERVFASLERQLRLCAGFRWHEPSSDADADDDHSGGAECQACLELARITRRHAEQFDEFCDEQMKGMFKDFMREAFHESVYSLYLKPSDAERFRKYNPADMSSARNIIAREQRELHQSLNERFVEPQMPAIWANLRGQYAEPAYTLLAALACRYSLQQMADGARLDTYIVSAALLEPHSYTAERAGQSRAVGAQCYTLLETTGTLLFRNKLQHSHGMTAPADELHYEHPLIVCCMNSVGVLYRGRMHRAPLGFGQAFLLWLTLLCTDRRLGGQLPNRANVHDLWALLAPDRADEAEQLRLRTERTVRRWDPVRQLMNCDGEVARLAARRNTVVTQF